MKKLIALLLTLALLVSLAACGNSAPDQTEPSENTGTAITVTDQAGREVTLDKPAQTIVSCYYITTYATIALGVSDRIVGLEKKADSRPIYHMAAPELLELPNVGSLKEFNVEAAAALQPDLVLMPAKLKSHADTLTDLGIAVLVVDPETQEGLEQMLTLIAAVCGVEDRAAALLEYYDQQVAAIGELVKGEEKPKVYMGSNSSYMETAPGAMYQSDLIDLAGGTNVAQELEGNYWTEVSRETILNWDPEVILIPCGASYTKEDILNDAELADCAAVKAGAVYQMPQEIEEWDSPIPSGVLGIMWTASVLHEDVYPFADFVTDAAEYYQEFYGFAIDTAVITK